MFNGQAGSQVRETRALHTPLCNGDTPRWVQWPVHSQEGLLWARGLFVCRGRRGSEGRCRLYCGKQHEMKTERKRKENELKRKRKDLKQIGERKNIIKNK